MLIEQNTVESRGYGGRQIGGPIIVSCALILTVPACSPRKTIRYTAASWLTRMHESVIIPSEAKAPLAPSSLVQHIIKASSTCSTVNVISSPRRPESGHPIFGGGPKTPSQQPDKTKGMVELTKNGRSNDNRRPRPADSLWSTIPRAAIITSVFLSPFLPRSPVAEPTTIGRPHIHTRLDWQLATSPTRTSSAFRGSS